VTEAPLAGALVIDEDAGRGGAGMLGVDDGTVAEQTNVGVRLGSDREGEKIVFLLFVIGRLWC